MSLSPVRASALVLALLLPLASGAFAQSSAPASPTPSAPSTQMPAKPSLPMQPAPPPKAPTEPASPAQPGTSPAQPGTPPVPAVTEKSGSADAGKPRTPQEIYADLELFGEVFNRIRAEYVDVVDERKLIHAALQGMLGSLDPHSGYLDPAEYQAMQVDTSGEFGGLGIQVTTENGLIKVISPIDDTPAQRAGILPNDLIIEINGKDVQGMNLNDAVKQMRGKVGTTISLTIKRENVDKPIHVTLTRAIIATEAVKWSLDGDVAVLRLTKFSEQAFPDLQKAITAIYAKRKGVPPEGIILDLRNNPGGLVDQAVSVADAFLKQGAIVLTRGRLPSNSARYDAKPDSLDAKLAKVPMIVLINGGTASAAEIVAGALQDHKRATILGTRSFGKGTVQSIIGLGQDGAMRLTTARYYTPSNRSIQAAGIPPDINIQEKVPADLEGRDKIVGEAGLPGQIGGGTLPQATTGSSVYVPADKTKDDQLQYAIKLIEGKATNPAYPPKGE